MVTNIHYQGIGFPVKENFVGHENAKPEGHNNTEATLSALWIARL
jgi:hypothetical protein